MRIRSGQDTKKLTTLLFQTLFQPEAQLPRSCLCLNVGTCVEQTPGNRPCPWGRRCCRAWLDCLALGCHRGDGYATNKLLRCCRTMPLHARLGCQAHVKPASDPTLTATVSFGSGQLSGGPAAAFGFPAACGDRSLLMESSNGTFFFFSAKQYASHTNKQRSCWNNEHGLQSIDLICPVTRDRELSL